MKHTQSERRGFTLIELLVVIAIIAVLSIVVILTLNPAELLKQARDSNRISDLSTVRSAVSLYLADVASPSIGTTGTCGMSAASSGATCGGRYSASVATSTQNGIFSVGGAGWVPVNFSSISSGAPIGNLPRDPTNNTASLFYSYTASSTGLVFELDAKMESAKYVSGGTSDVESTDGGSSTTLYEVGTSLFL